MPSESNTHLFSLPEDAPAVEDASADLLESHGPSEAAVVEAARAAASSAEEEMLRRDEALLSRLQALLPLLQAAAQRETDIGRGDAAARLAEAALTTSTDELAAQAPPMSSSSSSGDPVDASETRQRLMAACSQARRPTNHPVAVPTSAPTVAERQLRDALETAHEQLAAMARELEELRARCRQYEQRLAGADDELRKGEGTPYYMPTGESFVVHDVSMDAHLELYEIPPWWGKGTGHDKSTAGLALPAESKLSRIGSMLWKRDGKRLGAGASKVRPKYKLSSAWLEVLSPRLLLSERPPAIAGAPAGSPAAAGAPADTAPVPAAAEAAADNSAPTSKPQAPKPPPMKRVSSVGSRLWGKVRAKVLVKRGHYSPRPELRPATDQVASGYLGPKGPDGFPQLADPFAILEPHDHDHDDDEHYHEDDEHDHDEHEGEGEEAHHEAGGGVAYSAVYHGQDYHAETSHAPADQEPEEWDP